MKYGAFQNRMRGRGRTVGQQHKTDADVVMNATWDDDIQSRTAYIMDFFHDNDPYTFRDCDPKSNPFAQKVDIKFIVAQYASLSKDQPEYHIIFRPGQKQAVDYYDTSIGTYGAEYPIGLTLAIPDDEGKYNKWLICNKEIGNQFPKYLILPINYILHWVDKKRGELREYPVVIRSRNSQVVAHYGGNAIMHILRICWNTLRAVIPKRNDETGIGVMV